MKQKSLLGKLINTYRELPVPVKASIWFIICGVFKDAVDILVTPIFTRVLSAHEYGLFNVYNSWYQIFRVIFTFNLCSDVYTVGLSKYGDNRREYVSAVQGLLTVLLCIMTFIYLAGRSTWAEMMGLSLPLTFFMLLQVISYVPYGGWLQQMRFEYRYRFFAIVNIIYVVLQPTLGLLMIKAGFSGFTGGELRVMGTVSVQITIGIIIYIVNFLRSHRFFDRQIWKFSAGMNLPLIPHFLAQILLLQSAKLIIDAYIGKSATAVYSVANSAAFVIQVIVLNLNSAFLPWLYGKLKRHTVDGVKAYTSVLFLLSAGSVLLITLVAPEAMSLLGPKEYAAGIWVIPPLAFSVHLMFVYTQFANVQLYYEKKLRILICAIAGTAVCMGAGILLVPRMGWIVAGYTTMAGYLTIAVIHYFMLRRTCREEELSIPEMFDMRIIIGVTVGLAVLCVGISLLYNVTFIARYILFAALLVLVVIKRKWLLSFYKDLKSV